jgi:hypothetical protein
MQSTPLPLCAMQRLCAVPGGVKTYLASPGMLATPESRRCPFCPDGHRLRLHGAYLRHALFPDPAVPARIPVLRLLCARTGRTVSLLPDFCLPRRQHGPAILGAFLVAWAVSGRPLLDALRSVRRESPGHSVAQSLLRSFLGRLHALRSYLAARRPRLPDPPREIPAPRRHAAAVVLALLEGFGEAAKAFIHHGRAFHERFALALA